MIFMVFAWFDWNAGDITVPMATNGCAGSNEPSMRSTTTALDPSDLPGSTASGELLPPADGSLLARSTTPTGHTASAVNVSEPRDTV